MTVNSLVFSNNPRFRIRRHALFWLLWIVYYTIFDIVYWQGKYPLGLTFWASLAEITLSTPMDMIFCYAIIYYLLPEYLFKGRYLRMIPIWIFFSVVFCVAVRFYNHHAIPLIRKAFGLPEPVFTTNLPWAYLNLFYQINMEGGLAAAIKLGKMWFIKKQELDLIKKEKQQLERPVVQDGQLQPVFLINALDRMEQLALTKPSALPGMVDKIRNLLLYVIYDNNQDSVSLEKELALLEEYIELEKACCVEPLRVVVKVLGQISEERIAPFIILPLVENGFRQLSRPDLPERNLDLEIRVSGGKMEMKLAWSKPIDSSTLTSGNDHALHRVGRRLNLLYPGSHGLRVVITTEQFAIHLDLILDRGNIL